MEKEILRIPRPLRKVANKYAFTLPKQLVEAAKLQVNKTYTVVVLDGKEEKADSNNN
mgnify:CR=1 FL=1